MSRFLRNIAVNSIHIIHNCTSLNDIYYEIGNSRGLGANLMFPVSTLAIFGLVVIVLLLRIETLLQWIRSESSIAFSLAKKFYLTILL